MSIYSKSLLIKGLIGLTLLLTLKTAIKAQSIAPVLQAQPWTIAELLEPADLANTINTKPDEVQPLILSIGPAAMIKGSIDIGPVSDTDNLDKLKEVLSSQTRDQEIIIYCGCCPFDRCPNIRPAFKLLKDMHFTKAKLLNLKTNIRADWLDKGYPTENK